MYSNNQEYEMERLNDPLTSTPSESRVSATPTSHTHPLGNQFYFVHLFFQLVVRLGRALKPGEHRIKLYLLKINQTEVRLCTYFINVLYELFTGYRWNFFDAKLFATLSYTVLTCDSTINSF